MTNIELYDAAEYLDSPEMIETYLTGALETGDLRLIAMAIGAIARAQGKTDIAEEAGLPRGYLDLPQNGDALLELTTVLRVLNALGISLVAQTRAA